MSRPQKHISKERILLAIGRTKSNSAAARFLNISYPHYKRYAKLYKDPSTGESLFEQHLNQAGKGIPKIFDAPDLTREGLLKVLEGEALVYSWDPEKIKRRIVQEGFLEEKCDQCNFVEKRAIDQKAPLIIRFRDGDKSNWKLSNIGFLCYNCYFLYVGNVLTENQITSLEDYNPGNKAVETDWDLDPEMYKIFLDSGLVKEEKASDGTEFIDYE